MMRGTLALLVSVLLIPHVVATQTNASRFAASQVRPNPCVFPWKRLPSLVSKPLILHAELPRVPSRRLISIASMPMTSAVRSSMH